MYMYTGCKLNEMIKYLVVILLIAKIPNINALMLYRMADKNPRLNDQLKANFVAINN